MKEDVNNPIIIDIDGGVRQEREVVTGIVIQALDVSGFRNLGKINTQGGENIDRITVAGEKFKQFFDEREDINPPEFFDEDDSISMEDCTIEITVGSQSDAEDINSDLIDESLLEE